MSSTWKKTADMYRENVSGDSLFAAKTLNDGNDENSLNNARIYEAPDELQNSDIFEETDEIFGPPPLPKGGSKTGGKSKVPSLFDDSDSGDDLFSHTGSGFRSQKSADFLSTTTTSQSSEKSKIFRSKGLFDDDEDQEDNREGNDVTKDIFGIKNNSEVNLFDSKTSTSEISQENITSVGSIKGAKKSKEDSNFTEQESLDSSFEKQNTIKFSQTAPITKLGSIFDDIDDDDLFSPNFNKKTSDSQQKKIAPSLFDDNADDLFAVPSKSSGSTSQKMESEVVTSTNKIGDEVKSKIMEQLAAKLEFGKSERKVKDVESKNKKDSVVSEKQDETVKKIEEDIVSDKSEDGANNTSKNKPKNLAAKILDEIKTVQKSKIQEAEVKPGIAKKPDGLKKLDRKAEVVNKSELRKDFVSSKTKENKYESFEKTEVVSAEETVQSFESETRILSSEEKGSSKITRTENMTTVKDSLSESSTSEESSIAGRREPPKTLEIRSNEKSSVAQKRVVSGKIKNLMGRMSDLKILSPTDTPPVWRKNEDKMDEEGDKDSEDGSCLSTSKESPTLSEEVPKAPSLPSPTERKEIEPAISFDEPVQVKTLSVTTSKSRVRIQSKRRPQSRSARQIALRKSGIDFDSVDFSNDGNSDTNQNLSANVENNNPTATENSANMENIANSNTDRLIITGGSDSISVKISESSSSTFLDDRSEISFSKESTLSINKNTLLSPSTDEEDLFDVPPDLPEDPPKEDALFGRAPILSPVDPFVKVQKDVKHESRKSEQRIADFKEDVNVSSSQVKTSVQLVTNESSDTDKEIKKISFEGKSEAVEAQKKSGDQISGTKAKHRDVDKKEESDKALIDPLRDDSHDPLKDPSTLFPFVTKTPSPEKGKNLLFNEDDDSLFSSGSSVTKKKFESKEDTLKSNTNKKTIDLFADDPEVDFFTTKISKPVKKYHQESKIDLFSEDDNQDDDLFGRSKKKLTNKSSLKSTRKMSTENTTVEVKSSSKIQDSLFSDISDEKLFGSSKTIGTTKGRSANAKSSTLSGIFSDDESSEIFTSGKKKSSEVASSVKKTVEDIFKDQSSGEEDIFGGKKTVIKKSTVSSGLFGDDDNDDDDGGDLFGKSKSSSTVGQSISSKTETRGVVKKTATRDLRKTAEQIVEDPLSMLQKD